MIFFKVFLIYACTSFYPISIDYLFRLTGLAIKAVIWSKSCQPNSKEAFVIFESASAIETALEKLNEYFNFGSWNPGYRSSLGQLKYCVYQNKAIQSNLNLGSGKPKNAKRRNRNGSTKEYFARQQRVGNAQQRRAGNPRQRRARIARNKQKNMVHN